MYFATHVRGFGQSWRVGGKISIRWMSIAAALSHSEGLPLAGIRVLDMTRVLAGVCLNNVSDFTILST